MSTMLSIFKRELNSYFATPVAYVFIVIFLFLNGIFTFKLGGFFEANQANLDRFFTWHPWLYLFLIPAVAMRLWAEERRGGTIELLFTLPVSATQAILGKFLAAWFFVGIALWLTFPVVLTVLYLGEPDLGVIAAAYAGSFLMAGAYLAIGICMSAITKNQVVSFILSVVICLMLILAGVRRGAGRAHRLGACLADRCGGIDQFPHPLPIHPARRDQPARSHLLRLADRGLAGGMRHRAGNEEGTVMRTTKGTNHAQ